MAKERRKKAVTCTMERDLVDILRSVAYVSRRAVGDVLSASFIEYHDKHYRDLELPKVTACLKPGPKYTLGQKRTKNVSDILAKNAGK